MLQHDSKRGWHIAPPSFPWAYLIAAILCAVGAVILGLLFVASGWHIFAIGMLVSVCGMLVSTILAF